MIEITTRPPLAIDWVGDIVCPFCYVGFRALGWAGMALSFSHELDITYRPYRLDPETPPGGIDRAARRAEKIPDPDMRQAQDAALRAGMADVGLDFDPDAPRRLVPTTDAHRLLRWAHEAGLARETLEGLFSAYWHHGEDVSQRDVLVAVAEDAGLDPADIAARLATTEDRAAVEEEAAGFRGAGFDGIPAFIVNEEEGFSGALPKADLLAVLREIAAEAAD